LVDYIYKVLTEPEAQPPDLPQTIQGEARPPRRYQMLPHARPGGVAGLLELLRDHGGRYDMYRLADDLLFEIDHLLPIVDAAQLLGFLNVNDGTAVITDSGTDYADSEIARRRDLFREAAANRVLLLDQIVRAIEAKSDHAVSEDLFHDLLDDQFTEDETLLQLETAVSWGRYAQLFDFDASRRCFIRLEKRRSQAPSSAESVA
jgi:NitT/TauT family transport system ATP-binding protein